MAVTRDDPYGSFHFLVTISPESGGEFCGGFSDCSGLNTEITYAEYREGAEPFNVTLKRGLIAALDLWQWVSQVRSGNMLARATVVIQLRSEDSAGVVATWTLTRAWPSKWKGPTLAANGASDVAMEELVLVCEDIAYE